MTSCSLLLLSFLKTLMFWLKKCLSKTKCFPILRNQCCLLMQVLRKSVRYVINPHDPNWCCRLNELWIVLLFLTTDHGRIYMRGCRSLNLMMKRKKRRPLLLKSLVPLLWLASTWLGCRGRRRRTSPQPIDLRSCRRNMPWGAASKPGSTRFFDLFLVPQLRQIKMTMMSRWACKMSCVKSCVFRLFARF